MVSFSMVDVDSHHEIQIQTSVDHEVLQLRPMSNNPAFVTKCIDVLAFLGDVHRPICHISLGSPARRDTWV